MINTTLFKKSSFFVDVNNVVTYTDLFLYNELVCRMDNDTLLKDLFLDKIPKINSDKKLDRDLMMVQISASKKNPNILLDWIDIDKFNSHNFKFSIEKFLASLYYDFLCNPTCDEYLQFTEFGNTLKILLNDQNLVSLDLYIPFSSDFIIYNILDSLSGYNILKVHIIVGNKKDYLLNNKYDTYIFENCSDIDEYLDNKNHGCEVIVPSYEYNMIEGRTDIDKIMEQVTYHRLYLKNDMRHYFDKNILINTISVPI